MQSNFKHLLILLFIIADIVFVGVVYSLVFKTDYIDTFSFSLFLSIRNFRVIIFCWIILSIIFKLYNFNKGFILDKFYRSTWLTFGSQFLLLYIYVFLNLDRLNLFLDMMDVAIHFSLIVIYMLISRLCITYLINTSKIFHQQSFKVAIWGFNLTSIKLASYLEENGNVHKFLGIINEHENPIYSSSEDFNNSLILAINQAVDGDIQELYVVAQPQYLNEMTPYFKIADDFCIRLRFIPDFSMTVPESFISNNINNFQIIKAREEPLEEPVNRLKKRIFDLCLSLLVLVFVISWLYPIIGLIIKYQSRGPILFKQLRTGLNNKEFWCYKFRSMRVNNDSNQKQAEKNDTRITKIGNFIRRTSIDELPQFFNVLMGDMSIVGPRPHMVKHTEDYNKLIDNFMVRHFVKPGITGLSQISGFRGETKRVIDMQKRVNTDIKYLQNWSLFNDLKICILTVIITLKGDEKAF